MVGIPHFVRDFSNTVLDCGSTVVKLTALIFSEPSTQIHRLALNWGVDLKGCGN